MDASLAVGVSLAPGGGLDTVFARSWCLDMAQRWKALADQTGSDAAAQRTLLADMIHAGPPGMLLPSVAVYANGSFRALAWTQMVWDAHGQITLTAGQMSLLFLLIERRGLVVPYEELCPVVLGRKYRSFCDQRCISQQVIGLRRRINRPGGAKREMIWARYRVGYAIQAGDMLPATAAAMQVPTP